MTGKKITELTGSISPSITGSTVVAYGGKTYKTTLSTLKQVVVDGQSHYFTGSQKISGSLLVGTGSFHTDNPEILHVENSGSFNLAHFEGNHSAYSQINVKNINSGSNASTDLVITADNGTENVHFIDLGMNSSTYTGGFVGLANDAYLLNVGKDLYVGTVGGISHPSQLKLFANNSWENPQITISGSGQISFNTSSVSSGFAYEFSGSVKLKNNLNVSGSVTASYFVGDGSQLTNLSSQSTNVSMFLSSSTFNTFTSSYNDTSASFNTRILAATNEQNISNLATTGSNTFNGNQTINGSLILDNGAIIKDNINNSISFGYLAADTNQGTQSVAIGNGAGYQNQQHGAIAIGPNAGSSTQQSNGIAIGSLAGTTLQNTGSIAIGTQAGGTNQGEKAISLGYWSGKNDQEDYAISIGNLAGVTSQGLSAISIGNLAGSELQGSRSIAIGQQAGASNQGEYSIALGVLAGSMNQAANSIVINASGTVLQNTTTGSLKIAPIRNITGSSGILQYDDTTKEVSYSNTFSGSLTASYFVGDGSGLTNLPTPTLISSGLSTPGSAVVANDTDVDINFSGVGTKFSFAQSGMTINGFTILSQVTSSFVDDTAAAAGGVPLQGLYRSGSYVLIRLT